MGSDLTARVIRGSSLIAVVSVLLPAWVMAQAAQKRAPASLPPLLTAQSIHSTTATSVIAYDPKPQEFLLASIDRLNGSPQIDGRDFKRAPNACRADASFVCYDYRRRHAVVPMSKSLMPDMPGMKKEGMSVKRDKVSMSYSF